jgi:superfamily II DNA/RNA helicase
MKREDFLDKIKVDITNLISDTKLNNNKNQLFAWKLNTRFKRTFDENYLWNQSLFLCTNSCLLLQENNDEKVAQQGLFVSAEIFQYLSESKELFEQFDKDYLIILAAICYDIAGYQANAFCLASRITEYELSTDDQRIDLTIDNCIIDQIRLILTKSIPYAEMRLRKYINIQNEGFSLFYSAMKKWYSFIFKQDNDQYLINIERAYHYYLNIGNTYISHLLLLLKVRMSLFNKRSIYNGLYIQLNDNLNYQWKKYIKLLGYDYYDKNKIKSIEERKSFFEFWTSQLQALEKGLLTKDENFVVQMPTSSGKTFIAELLILKYLNLQPDKKCIYIAPFRALTNEKENEFGKYFSKLGYVVSSLSGSYEIDAFQDVVLNETNLLIATPEKIDCLLRFAPEYFNNVSLIVVDEGHIISDFSTRATLLEFLIIRLRIKIHELRTLFISAVMPPQNANEYSLWLNGNNTNVLRSLKYKDSDILDEWEPTKKLISYFKDGNIYFKDIKFEDERRNIKIGAILNSYLMPEFKYENRITKIKIAARLAYKLSEEGATLVFCAQQRYTEDIAETLLGILKCINYPNRFNENKNKESSYYANIWYDNNSIITKAINHGIGLHFGDMPEQVRIAVENDFKNGLLYILLSTNTIGQGLNFPIKNLIFYSLIINYNKNGPVMINHRDFWNIVGRSGRAGKETEGKIIFIINSKYDEKLFWEFTNRINIENAESLFFKALMLRVNNTIKTDDEFDKIIAELSETYLLDLITEECIGTDYEEILEKIIQNALFKIQLDKRNINIKPIRDAFKKIFMSFEKESKIEELKEYKKTGFSFKTNKLISDFINSNLVEIKNIITNDDYIAILNYFFRLLNDNNIPELTNEKLNKIFDNEHKIMNAVNIVIGWVNGKGLNDLISEWKKTIGLDINSFHILLSQGLYYLYPWGMSAFLLLVAYKLNYEYKDLPDNIKSIPSYLKYGLNNENACLARSLGIKSRENAIMLYEKSNHLTKKEFIRWLSNLTNDEINTFGINNFDNENINEISLRINHRNFSNIISEYIFEIKGTIFNSNWAKESKIVKVNDIVTYKRDENNIHDPFAIIILHENNPIGFVPRDYAKLLSTEIDIEEKIYNANVISISHLKTYNKIKIKMTEELKFVSFE